MLEGAKQNDQDNQQKDDDFLLVDDGNRNLDIITHGERIADTIGKVKTIQPSLLASQLTNLKLNFVDETIQNLNNVSKCIAIEGVEVSQEELDALTEATKAKAEAENNVGDLKDEIMQMEMGSAAMRKPVAEPAFVSQAKTTDLMAELDNMNLGGKSKLGAQKMMPKM